MGMSAQQTCNQKCIKNRKSSEAFDVKYRLVLSNNSYHKRCLGDLANGSCSKLRKYFYVNRLILSLIIEAFLMYVIDISSIITSAAGHFQLKTLPHLPLNTPLTFLLTEHRHS